MEAAITSKLARFVELSTFFSKKEEEIFNNEALVDNRGILSFSSSDLQLWSASCGSIVISDAVSIHGQEVFIDENGYVKAKDNKPLSKADEIRAKAEIQAKLMEDFQEYLELQKLLGEYFEVTNKLT